MKKNLSSASLRKRIKINSRKLFGSAADFEMAFHEGVLARDPDNVDAMTVLAHLYSSKGMYAEGLALDLKLSFLDRSNPVAFYNLACSYALLGRPDEAFDTLSKAVALGWLDWKRIESDSDFAQIKSDPRFAPFIEKLKGTK